MHSSAPSSDSTPLSILGDRPSILPKVYLLENHPLLPDYLTGFINCIYLVHIPTTPDHAVAFHHQVRKEVSVPKGPDADIRQLGLSFTSFNRYILT